MDSPPESQTGNVPQIQKESHQKRPSAILRARLSFQTCRCENIFPLLTLIFNTNFAYDEPLPGASGQKLRLKDYSPDDKSLFSGTKEESLIEFDKLREELQELQKNFCPAQAQNSGYSSGYGCRGQGRLRQACLLPGGSAGAARSTLQKPTTEELDHDFLWRVHKEVPAKGQIAIFNRSHYEDIIAVRVKKSSRTQSGNAATSMSSTLNPCLRKKEPSSSSYS